MIYCATTYPFNGPKPIPTDPGPNLDYGMVDLSPMVNQKSVT